MANYDKNRGTIRKQIVHNENEHFIEWIILGSGLIAAHFCRQNKQNTSYLHFRFRFRVNEGWCC